MNETNNEVPAFCKDIKKQDHTMCADNGTPIIFSGWLLAKTGEPSGTGYYQFLNLYYADTKKWIIKRKCETQWENERDTVQILVSGALKDIIQELPDCRAKTLLVAEINEMELIPATRI